MPPNQTYDERRAEVKESTRRSIKKARTADRQARNRARQNRRAKPDYKHLTKAQQTAATAAAEEHVMESRCREGIDGDSHLTKALDEESAKLYAIDSEENTEKLKKLPTSAGPSEQPAMAERSTRKTAIQNIYRRKIDPIIKRWERCIAVVGREFEPAVSQTELDQFLQSVSNPADVRDYLERWNTADADCEEDLSYNMPEEVADDVEVVVSDDDDDEDEGEDDDGADLAGFVVGDDEF